MTRNIPCQEGDIVDIDALILEGQSFVHIPDEVGHAGFSRTGPRRLALPAATVFSSPRW